MSQSKKDEAAGKYFYDKASGLSEFVIDTLTGADLDLGGYRQEIVIAFKSGWLACLDEVLREMRGKIHIVTTDKTGASEYIKFGDLLAAIEGLKK